MRWGRAAWWMLQAFFAAWVVAVFTTEADCAGLGYDCDPHAGRAAAVTMIVVVWMIADAVLASMICLFRGARRGRRMP